MPWTDISAETICAFRGSSIPRVSFVMLCWNVSSVLVSPVVNRSCVTVTMSADASGSIDIISRIPIIAQTEVNRGTAL